jgi:hypothetical protein
MLGPHSEPVLHDLAVLAADYESCVSKLRAGPTCRAKTQYECRRLKRLMAPQKARRSIADAASPISRHYAD